MYNPTVIHLETLNHLQQIIEAKRVCTLDYCVRTCVEVYTLMLCEGTHARVPVWGRCVSSQVVYEGVMWRYVGCVWRSGQLQVLVLTFHLPFCCSGTGLPGAHYCGHLYIGAGDANPESHACETSAFHLPTICPAKSSCFNSGT